MPEPSRALYRSGEGETLVLLHGFTGTWQHWRPVLGDLAARFEVIAPTLAALANEPDTVGRRDDGLGLYRYRYLWSDTVYVGVMAQEVALIHPEAVVRGVFDNYLRVDYGRLGLKLMTLPEWDARSKGERL